MDHSTTSSESSQSPSKCVNGGGSMRRPSPSPCSPAGTQGRPASLLDHAQSQPHLVRVVVNRDEKGYGMKVSGDNPIYVQSVKEGGAAERAGLHAGDKIIKVNGVNVMNSTHIQVVALIKSSSQVVLTVQQRSNTSRSIGSPSLQNRPVTTPTSSRITGPQPVDNEKQYQLQLEKEQYYKLMIEKEQHYVDLLRSQIASSPDEKKCKELAKTERNLQTLQGMLLRTQSEQQSPPKDLSPRFSSSPSSSSSPRKYRPIGTPPSPNGNSDVPPPLPKRNNHHPSRQKITASNNKGAAAYVNGKVPQVDVNNFLCNEINANLAEAQPPQQQQKKKQQSNVQPNSPDQPPPLPPRAPLLTLPPPPPLDPDAANSINKQMSYPLVATCATLVNDCVSNDPSPHPTHHRTKSSPETLTILEENECPRKLSESMDDLSRKDEWKTPPGTPPPPYPSPRALRREGIPVTFDDDTFEEPFVDSTDNTPICASVGASRLFLDSSQATQQPIMSMEDDEISDTELSQLENHGYFQSFSKLMEHLPHLAVFINYILSMSNTDPSSLLFYLVTDLYKEGNAKEMRKWAFEINSCFLIPEAPLRLSNVEDNIAYEIDEVLSKEFDKEEILRKVFWKARHKAKEELTNQLADFRQKRTTGLGTIYGPKDEDLAEVENDKAKEMKLYESLFFEKLERYLEEVEKDSFDSKRYYTAAAFVTVLTRIFQIRPVIHALDRCPTFVNKEKSFRTKFIGRYSRKLHVQGHQYVARQYYTAIMCKNCQQILFGIGPQGYQCSICLINLHRHCVNIFEVTCPGPIKEARKDRGIMKLIGMRHDSNEQNRLKKNSQFLQAERERRQAEEKDSNFELNDSESSYQQEEQKFTVNSVNEDLARIIEWSNLVEFDAKKGLACLFSKKADLSSLNIQMSAVTIPKKSRILMLGITISNNFSYESHVRLIAEGDFYKVQRNTSLLVSF